jgi:acyl-CoA synthetase (AMP-forming)/AMP-acid ligase II
MPKFSTPETLRLLREELITLLLGVPTMFQYLLQEARDDGPGADEPDAIPGRDRARRCASNFKSN